MVDHYSVRDRHREIQFKGELLGFSSSEDPDKVRWGEFYVYRTESGRYVVAGVGRSRVPGETDRCWAQVSDSPDAVIEKLTLIDPDGARYLPWTARTLLDQAAVKDERLRHSYAVEVID